ncbi:hypothetical protein H2204_013680 [Knufia peltigerae]|uniref:Uncharacterized protein n=1 Tax=Knufia peltigerae TaxID=1002370 RepID=A0AA39CPW8_9EURO|nr:hypothetical protein H2204_013680 [Knufia peltigerae]
MNNQIPQHGARARWPGEREPDGSDAESAYRPIDASLTATFKNAMFARTRLETGVEYLQKDELNPLLVAETSAEPLHWPASALSANVSEDHGFSATEIKEYVELCTRDFISKAPFLRDVPASLFCQLPAPLYFTLAMACIGAMLGECSIERSSKLWWSSLRLLMGQLEVDNREARKMELIKAWVLLESYGLLSSDRLTWNRTSMAHGYVETAVWRLLDQLRDSEDDARNHPNFLSAENYLKLAIRFFPVGVLELTPKTRPIVSYFALVDLLRSYHFSQASNLSAPEVLCIVNPQRPKTALGNDPQGFPNNSKSALTSLVGIMGRVHTLALVFNPLLRIPADRVMSTARWKPCDYIPFSGAMELAEMTSRLFNNLDTWRRAYSATAKPEVILLWHFCQLYLSLPGLQLLIELSGYPPRCPTDASGIGNTSYDASAKLELVTYDLKRGQEASEHAWKILALSSDCSDTLATVIWKPLALFCAGLVIWGSISVQKDGSAQATLKILNLFEAEISKTKSPGAREMSETLRRLEGRPLGMQPGGCLEL